MGNSSSSPRPATTSEKQLQLKILLRIRASIILISALLPQNESKTQLLEEYSRKLKSALESDPKTKREYLKTINSEIEKKLMQYIRENFHGFCSDLFLQKKLLCLMTDVLKQSPKTEEKINLFILQFTSNINTFWNLFNSPLLTLPKEINDNILSYLDGTSLRNLLRTSRYFSYIKTEAKLLEIMTPSVTCFASAVLCRRWVNKHISNKENLYDKLEKDPDYIKGLISVQNLTQLCENHFIISIGSPIIRIGCPPPIIYNENEIKELFEKEDRYFTIPPLPTLILGLHKPQTQLLSLINQFNLTNLNDPQNAKLLRQILFPAITIRGYSSCKALKQPIVIRFF